ncbi:MAG: glycosyltransferase family 4 protein [Thermosynechococcaceae cyanobacterium MS004]|nr:glycosyltransferase family 4 protein [Thermosynechococcaceae cyanobacterium MS004]
MKPFLIVAADFVKTGGMDRANYALADFLAREGGEVVLVAYRADQDLLKNKNIRFVKVPKILNSYALSEPILRAMGKQEAEKVAKRNGRVLVNGGNCQWNEANWVHYVHAAYTPEVKTGWVRILKQKYNLKWALRDEQNSLKAARIIIANSNRTRRDIIDNYGIPEERIKVIYYGSDPNLFYPATETERRILRKKFGWLDDRKKAMFIGALGDRRKGFDTLFEAWKELRNDPAWDVDLIVVGKGAELPLWEERALNEGLKGKIQFLGFRNDVPDLLRASDLLIAPTRYEAYGLGVHEAICCGLPAIVSSSAGIVERYPDSLKKLLLDNTDNHQHLIESMRFWHDNITFLESQILQTKNKFIKHGWDIMAKEIINIVNN